LIDVKSESESEFGKTSYGAMLVI